MRVAEKLSVLNKIIQGDALEVLRTMPAESVDCCITSPPYYGLRDYGVPGQIGQEETPEEYIERLVEVFREVRRVLSDQGTLWLNIADSWCGSQKGRYKDGKAREGKSDDYQGRRDGTLKWSRAAGCKRKDLIGIPWMLAFALRADGWYLRQDIIWEKGNPMPESVKDRCTKSHEYIFLMAKSEKYYFDHAAIQEPAIWKPGTAKNVPAGGFQGKWTEEHGRQQGIQSSFRAIREFRNKRDVWRVNVRAYKGAHFATFPEELITPCILAGTGAGGGAAGPVHGSRHSGCSGHQKWPELCGHRAEPRILQTGRKTDRGG
nr:MAG TPA: adenine-specific methyltransferase [Caudoviricetes sp.]